MEAGGWLADDLSVEELLQRLIQIIGMEKCLDDKLTH